MNVSLVSRYPYIVCYSQKTELQIEFNDRTKERDDGTFSILASISFAACQENESKLQRYMEKFSNAKNSRCNDTFSNGLIESKLL